MSAGFGFSVGDFLAALKVISDVIDALRDSGNSSTECRQLLRQLLDLETALIHVKRLDLDETQSDQLNALRRSASQCRTTIDEFMTKIHKYQPHLYQKGSLNAFAIKQTWYKIKWALCRKEDVEKLRADLVGHTEAINILMNAISIGKMTLQSKRNADQHLDLKTIVQDCYSRTMQKLSAIKASIAISVSNSKKLLEITAQTAQTDCKIFGVVLDIQDLLRKVIAPQILRAQPVYFVDAMGVSAPFYLEFIRSPEALRAVLRCNLEGNDSAVARIDRGDYVITDAASNRDIDLKRPWNMCFRPGQRVDMSMILDDRLILQSTCPSCMTGYVGDGEQDIVCAKCGLTFRRFADVTSQDIKGEGTLTESDDFESENPGGIVLGPELSAKKRKREEDTANELVMYRKVRLRQSFDTEEEQAAVAYLREYLFDSDQMMRFEDHFVEQPEMYKTFAMTLVKLKERSKIGEISDTLEKLLRSFSVPNPLLQQSTSNDRGCTPNKAVEIIDNNERTFEGARRQDPGFWIRKTYPDEHASSIRQSSYKKSSSSPVDRPRSRNPVLVPHKRQTVRNHSHESRRWT